ncbi:MAG: Smr/MutS family protein [Caulobacteraceae bacterium]
MKRPLGRDEQRLWSRVLADVRPRPGRTKPTVEPEEEAVAPPQAAKPAAAPARIPAKPKPAAGLYHIEPNRARRIALGREAIGARLDLHGMTQDQARAALERFIIYASDEGWRAVLVITGKGSTGDGVLRRYTPEWLASPPLRGLIAGVSEARHRHGGKGALYVALKQRR